MIAQIFVSWWHFAGKIVLGYLALAAGIGAAVYVWPHQWLSVALTGVLAVALVSLLLVLARRAISWQLTSERIIERRGILYTHRRELELSDIRSVEVDRSLVQRLLGLGDVTVSSAASADFVIKLVDISDPEGVATVIREARLGRLR